VAAGHRHDCQQVAERVDVAGKDVVADEAERWCVKEQRPHAKRRRRWNGDVGVEVDDTRLAVALPQQAVAARLEVLAHVLLDELAGILGIEVYAPLDRLLHRSERALATLVLGVVVGDMRQHVQRGIEMDGALDPFRCERAELRDHAAAERMSEQCRPLDVELVEGVEDVDRVLVASPRWLPAGPAVPSQIRRDHSEPVGEPLLGQLAEALPVRRYAVQADQRRRARVAPLVDVQSHDREDNARVKLEVVEGDIAALEVDAVANAANDHLWMGAGVAGALKRAGGVEIEREAVAKGPIPLGTAVATGAGRLPARFVVHGAVMGQDLETSAELVRETTGSCLAVADELGCVSLALPAFGTGVGGFPLGECARIMVDVAQAFAPKSLERVVFAVFGAGAKVAFDRALATR
jgi:O-acetyl-ADP-ribose deacetylase (regulator of RNase III)